MLMNNYLVRKGNSESPLGAEMPRESEEENPLPSRCPAGEISVRIAFR